MDKLTNSRRISMTTGRQSPDHGGVSGRSEDQAVSVTIRRRKVEVARCPRDVDPDFNAAERGSLRSARTKERHVLKTTSSMTAPGEQHPAEEGTKWPSAKHGT
jgi:hypothetical protein